MNKSVTVVSSEIDYSEVYYEGDNPSIHTETHQIDSELDVASIFEKEIRWLFSNPEFVKKMLNKSDLAKVLSDLGWAEITKIKKLSDKVVIDPNKIMIRHKNSGAMVPLYSSNCHNLAEKTSEMCYILDNDMLKIIDDKLYYKYLARKRQLNIEEKKKAEAKKLREAKRKQREIEKAKKLSAKVQKDD